MRYSICFSQQMQVKNQPIMIFMDPPALHNGTFPARIRIFLLNVDPTCKEIIIMNRLLHFCICWYEPISEYVCIIKTIWRHTHRNVEEKIIATNMCFGKQHKRALKNMRLKINGTTIKQRKIRRSINTLIFVILNDNFLNILFHESLMIGETPSKQCRLYL